MLHDNMDLSRLMVHVQQVEDIRKKRGIRDVRRPKPSNQARLSNGGNGNNFGVLEQPRFKKGHQSSGNSNSRKRASPKGGRLEPKKVNGGDVQHPRRECAMCGHTHSGECRQCTNTCFGCGKNGHKVRDCP